MAGWRKTIAIGLLGLFSWVLWPAATMALPLLSHQRVIEQPAQSLEKPPQLAIAPKLTSPAETPIAEAVQESPPLTWWAATIATAEITESRPPSNDSIDATVEQWLLSAKTFFVGE